MAGDFKKGDHIAGIANNGYGYTNEKMLEAKVLETGYNGMTIQVLRHTEINKVNETAVVLNSARKFKKISNGGIGMNINGLLKDFGLIKDGSVAVTFDGKIAIRTADGYVVYNSENGSLANQMDMVLKDVGFIYIMPAAEVKKDDIIKQNNNFYYIVSVNDRGSLNVINFSDGTVEVLAKGTNLLGKNIFYKVVNPLGQLDFKSGDSSFDPMMLMFINQSGGSDIKEIMLLQMLMGKSDDKVFNPMMLMAMGGGDLDMKTLMLFSMLNK